MAHTTSNMNLNADTIVAISTPPGRGGIGIVRLSGPDSRVCVEPLLSLRNPLSPAAARFAHILDLTESAPDAPSPAILDEAIVTFYAAPHSYTGEDLVEIAAHGAPVLLDYLLRQCLLRGARLAEPGEFTQRAFLSGRLDLTQAEAVHDLIASSTLHQARVAARQLGGGLAHLLQPIKQGLLALIAALEAGIDFAEDDIDTLPVAQIAARIATLDAPLRALAATFHYGRIVRDGFTLAIVGRPNAGKSSLFNRLIERPRAIVTAAPGTTRDPIHERIAIAGIPVELIDTAGLREASDEAEQHGIRKSREAMADADIVLLVLAADAPLDEEDRRTLAAHSDSHLLVALNKIDLTPHASSLLPGAPTPIRTSALTGDGLVELRAAILNILEHTAPSADSALLTNLRQHTAVSTAVVALEAAEAANTASVPHEMILMDLHRALDALDTLTGATTSDDILHLIFSTFCIGK